MKKILLVGTSFSAAPIAQCIKAMGYELHICGNQPTDPCVSWAGQYHCLNYSDSDLLLSLVKKEAFSSVIPSCNDSAYLSVVKVAQNLGMEGFDNLDVTLKLHDKYQFREFASSLQIPVPKVWNLRLDDIQSTNIDYPILIKPVDSFSGKGITKLYQPDGIFEAVESAKSYSRSNNYVIESFMDGDLHSHSAFLKDTKIVHDFFVDEFCTIYPYQVNCSNSPSRLNDYVREKMRTYIEKLSSSLNLVDGLLHTQFIVSGGEPYLIECMRRCPGDLFYHLVSFSTENSYIANYLRPFLGKAYQFLKNEKNIPWARHTISISKEAVIHGYSINETAEEMRFFQISESGVKVKKAPYGKVGIFFVRYKSPAQLFENAKHLANKVVLYTNHNILL